MNQYVKRFPQWIWLSSLIVNKITLASLDLQRVTDVARRGRIATDPLARITGLVGWTDMDWSHLNHVCQEIESQSFSEMRSNVAPQKKLNRPKVSNRATSSKSSKDESKLSSCSRCDRNGHTYDSCWAQTKLDGSRLSKPANKPGDTITASKTSTISTGDAKSQPKTRGCYR